LKNEKCENESYFFKKNWDLSAAAQCPLQVKKRIWPQNLPGLELGTAQMHSVGKYQTHAPHIKMGLGIHEPVNDHGFSVESTLQGISLILLKP